MNGPVDVLAVMGRLIKFCEADFNLRRDASASDHDLYLRARRTSSAIEARAAVVELIEATKEFRAGIAALVICQEQDAPPDIYEAVAEKFQKAADRQDAALANIGPQS